MLFIQAFCHRTYERRPEHGLKKAVKAPDWDDDFYPGKKSGQQITDRGGRQSGKNHIPGVETVSHKAAEKLADSIGDKTAGNRKSGQAFADIQGTLDLSKAGSIIQTGEVADKINQAAEKA